MMDLVLRTVGAVLSYFGLLIQFQGKAGASPEQMHAAVPRAPEEKGAEEGPCRNTSAHTPLRGLSSMFTSTSLAL